jgi:hypothetical protein
MHQHLASPTQKCRCTLLLQREPQSLRCLLLRLRALQAGLSLEVYGVGDGAPARSAAAALQRTSNLAGLHELLAQAAGSYKALAREVDMCAMFTLKDTASTGYKASLTVGSNLKIEVEWACCKRQLMGAEAGHYIYGSHGQFSSISLYHL